MNVISKWATLKIDYNISLKAEVAKLHLYFMFGFL